MRVETGTQRATRGRKSTDVLTPTPATVADHPAVLRFLNAVFQGPSADEFLALCDDPYYDPSDRLLIKHADQILAHVHLTWRTLHFGAARWPLCRLNWLGVLPEYREQGLSDILLEAVEHHLHRLGAAVVEVGCKQLPPVKREGWIGCGRYLFSQASPRDILSHLSSIQPPKPKLAEQALAGPVPQITTRIWRRIELKSLMRIYRENTAEAYGALQRSEVYWRWLVTRSAFDQIYVAVVERDRLSGGDPEQRIVGYAVSKKQDIVEITTEPGHEQAATELLKRACRDAIERDYLSVRVHGSAEHPMHGVVQAAGGSLQQHERSRGETMRLWLPNEREHLERIESLLRKRLQQASFTLPCELGLELDGQKHRLVIEEASTRIDPGLLGRSYITCDLATWIRLLLGYDSGAAALEAERIKASTAIAADTVSTLFPPIPLWRPPWDDLAV